MRWRALVAVAFGVLLALPLTLVFLSRHATPGAGGWRLSPRLPPEERVALPSLLKACVNDSDCEPPLACFWDPRYLLQLCQGSDCIGDSHCPVGHVCRWIPAREGTKVAVSHCVPVGLRQEGEPCVRLRRLEEPGCAEGLVCADWCGRRCGGWWSGGCPAGFFCAQDNPDGPVCLPTCEGRGCPEGQRCVRLEAGVSTCAVVHGQDCQRESCAEGQRCEVDMTPLSPGEAWMRCVWPCTGEGYTSEGCPSELSCLDGECRERCVVTDANQCGPEATCIPMGGEGGVCVPTLEPVRDGG
jgi:hypothetical protein